MSFSFNAMPQWWCKGICDKLIIFGYVFQSHTQLISTHCFSISKRVIGTTKFRGNRSRDFGFRTQKPPRKFGVKSSLSQKRLKYGKKYFIWLYVLKYPFIPTNPLLAAMRFFPFFSFFSFFFSFFFFLIFVRSSSLKPQNIEI